MKPEEALNDMKVILQARKESEALGTIPMQSKTVTSKLPAIKK